MSDWEYENWLDKVPDKLAEDLKKHKITYAEFLELTKKYRYQKSKGFDLIG